jgi:integrase
MAVRKRGKTWVIDYRVNGKKIVRAVGPYKRDAVAAEGKIKAQIREGRFFDCKPRIFTPLSELIQRYREDQRGKRSAVSEAYHLKVIELYYGSERIIQHLDRAAVDAFLRARRDTPTQYGRPRSTATVNREFAALRGMLNKAVAWGLLERNPVSGIKMPREPKGRTRFLTMNEAKCLLDACSPHLLPIVLCALESGMRRGEILNLRWLDIDLENRLIYVGQTKTGIPRYVPLSTRLHDVFIRVPRSTGNGFIFTGEPRIGKIGLPFHDVRSSFDSACEKAGIENFRFHDLRHTAASHMVMVGVPLKTVAEILGHTTTAMTERYSHLLPEHKLKAVDGVAPITTDASRCHLSTSCTLGASASSAPCADELRCSP